MAFAWPQTLLLLPAMQGNMHKEYHTITANLQVKLRISCASESTLVLLNQNGKHCNVSALKTEESCNDTIVGTMEAQLRKGITRWWQGTSWPVVPRVPRKTGGEPDKGKVKEESWNILWEYRVRHLWVVILTVLPTNFIIVAKHFNCVSLCSLIYKIGIILEPLCNY